MKIHRALLLTAMVFCTLYSCIHSQDDTQVETYEFLNQIFANAAADEFIEDSIIYLSDQNTLPPPALGDFDNTTDYLADLLEVEDKEHIQNQFRNGSKINLEELKSKNLIVVPASQLGSSSDYDEYFKENGLTKPEGLYIISKPVFSSNYNKAYFRIGYLCGGLCGGNQDRYYEKENGKWTLKEIVGASVY